MSTSAANAADNGEVQEQVSVFDHLYHQTRINYPVLALLQASETPTLVRPEGDTQRYGPVPLINNANVIENTHFHDQEKYAYIVISKAREGDAEWFRSANIRQDGERLAEDMFRISTCVGATTLDAVLFQEGAEQNLCIRIWRHSWVGWETEEGEYDEAAYVMSWEEFADIDSSMLWYAELEELVLARSDRAAINQAMAWQIETNRRPNWQHWLPARGTDMVRAVGLMVDEVSDEQLNSHHDDKCISCWSGWDDVRCAIMQTNCCRRLFCLSCLVADSTLNGLGFRCPMCRRAFFDTAAKAMLEFSLDQNGNYVNDDRFTAWENQERSFADLDENAAFLDETSRVYIAPEILQFAWMHVLRHSANEPESSTPWTQNPARFAEARILDIAVAATLLGYQGGLVERKVKSPKAVYAILKHGIRQRLCKEYTESPSFAFENESQSDNVMEYWGHVRAQVLRPGFWIFVSRALSRTVNFLKYRVCQCKGVTGPHCHGHRRTYFSIWQARAQRPSKTSGAGGSPVRKRSRELTDGGGPSPRKRMSG